MIKYLQKVLDEYPEELKGTSVNMAADHLFQIRGKEKAYFLEEYRVKTFHRVVAHRWSLPVLCYPRIMVIYHYPLVGVIFMVILHVFIIKNDPNFFQIITLNIHFGQFIPFMHLGEFIYEFNFPEYYPVVREEMEMLSFFWYPLSDKKMISYGNYMVILSVNRTRGN